ncbi:hypothetical protein GW17_00049946 [Ensete ventricosum]|nr:hypothetical protein GW17_00049946 [Ensete ventricosum]
MWAMYHRGRSQIVSTNKSHKGDLIIQRYDQSDWRVGILQCLYSLKGARQVRGQGRENERCYQGSQGEQNLREPCNKIAKAIHESCNARQRIVGSWAGSAIVPQRRDFRGVIDPLLSWRESIGREISRGGGECRGKLQVPRQGGRAETKELHKTGVDGLLIKIA